METTKIGLDQQAFINLFGKEVWEYDSPEDFLEFELEGVQKLWENLKDKNYHILDLRCVPMQSTFDIEPDDDDDLDIFYDNEKNFFVINGETYFLDDFLAEKSDNMWDGYQTTSMWSADLIIISPNEWLFEVDIDNSVIMISVSW